MRVIPSRNLPLAMVCIVGGNSASAQAPEREPEEIPWRRLASDSVRELDLRYRLWWTGKGWQLEFRNHGTKAVHFALRLGEGAEAVEEANSGRIHLEPGQGAAPFIAEPGLKASRIVGIRNGVSDLVTNVEFDEWGNRSKISFASGASSEWTSKDFGLHLKDWTVKYAGTTNLYGPKTYGYTSDRLTSAAEWSVIQPDEAGRVLAANSPELGINTTHAYDAYGNASLHAASGGNVPPTMTNFSFAPSPNNAVPGGASGWAINGMGEATAFGRRLCQPDLPLAGVGWAGTPRLRDDEQWFDLAVLSLWAFGLADPRRGLGESRQQPTLWV